MNHLHETILGGLAALLLAGCSAAAAEPTPPASPEGEVALSPAQLKSAQISTTRAQLRDLDNLVHTSGRVAFDDLKVSHVFSPVTGRVTRIVANPGDRVKKGAPLAVIESPDVGSAFSDVEKAQADLFAAEHDYQRQKELFQSHAAAEKDYESAEDNYRKAQAELSRAEQKARLLRSGTVNKVTQEYTLRAPLDGEVIARSVNPGTEVQGQYSGGQAQELFTVGELDPVWVMADLFELDLARVKSGTTATIRVAAYPGKEFPGTVDWISDALDPATRSAKVRIAVPNPEHLLKPEMYAETAMQAPSPPQLAVPRTAVVRLGDQTVVFVKVGATPDGKLRFERRPVAIDEDQAGAFVHVLRGVEAGEEVVSSGAILLTELLPS